MLRSTEELRHTSFRASVFLQTVSQSRSSTPIALVVAVEGECELLMRTSGSL